MDYFKYTCTLKLKLHNYHRVFVLIYFWKIRKVEFAQKFLHVFLVVKQSPLFGKLEKKQKSYYLRSFEKTLDSKKWTHFFIWDFFTLWIRNWCKKRDSVCPFFLSSFVLISKPFSISTWSFSIFLCNYIKTNFDINMVIFYLPLYLHQNHFRYQHGYFISSFVLISKPFSISTWLFRS